MNEQPLTSEQEAAAERLGREFIEQLQRVAVDMQSAVSRLREVAPPIERQITSRESEITFTIDASGIVETLRGLLAPSLAVAHTRHLPESPQQQSTEKARTRSAPFLHAAWSMVSARGQSRRGRADHARQPLLRDLGPLPTDFEA